MKRTLAIRLLFWHNRVEGWNKFWDIREKFYAYPEVMPTKRLFDHD
jgi:hypothetical protein